MVRLIRARSRKKQAHQNEQPVGYFIYVMRNLAQLCTDIISFFSYVAFLDF